MSVTDRILRQLQELNERLGRIEERMDVQHSRTIGIGQAADLLGVSTAAIRQRIRRGTIECSKSGSRYAFKKDYILTLIK